MSISSESVWQELKDAALATINAGDCTPNQLMEFLESVGRSCSTENHLREKALEFYKEWLRDKIRPEESYEQPNGGVK
jgi:hypothetical protein